MCAQLTLFYPTITKYGLQLLSTTGLHLTLLRCFIPIVIQTKIGHKFIEPRMHATRSTFVNRTIKSWNQLPASLLASFSCIINI